MAARKTFHHGDLKSALIDATLALLDARGVAGISLREVARAAGVSSGAPYHHFATRTDLLAEVALRGFAALAEEIARAEGSSRLPGVRLERRVLAYLRFAVAHPAHYRTMFLDELRGSPPGAHVVYEAVARSSFASLAAAVADVRPELSAMRARELAFTVWAAAHGAALLAMEGTPTALGVEGGPRRDALDATASHLRSLVEHA